MPEHISLYENGDKDPDSSFLYIAHKELVSLSQFPDCKVNTPSAP